jgi:hypothetical protein
MNTEDKHGSVWEFILDCLEHLPEDTIINGKTKKQIVENWSSVMTARWDEPYEVLLIRVGVAMDFGISNPYETREEVRKAGL